MRSALKRWSLEAENPRKSGYRPPAPHVSSRSSNFYVQFVGRMKTRPILNAPRETAAIKPTAAGPAGAG